MLLSVKYGIKSKEDKEAEKLRQQEELMGGPLGEGGLNRAKKTPEELAAEANQDDFTSECDPNVIPLERDSTSMSFDLNAILRVASVHHSFFNSIRSMRLMLFT